MLKNIHRRKSLQGQPIGTYVASSGETGKLGLEGEIQKLRNDKTFLMQEIIQMQQEHRGRAQQIEDMTQRMEKAEQRQKLMVSFLAKVLQNPVFLTRLKQMKEQKVITSPRVRRKFVKQNSIDECKQDSPDEGKIVDYNAGVDGLSPSSSADKQLADNLLQDMEGKVGLSASPMHGQNGNAASEKLEQEFIGDFDQGMMGAMQLELLDCEGPITKEKETGNFEPEVDADYLSSFPEDFMEERTFPDIMSPGVESIKQEDVWSMEFDTDLSIPISDHEVWGNLVDFDAQELGVSGGLSSLWDLGSQPVAGGSVNNGWPDRERSYEDLDH